MNWKDIYNKTLKICESPKDENVDIIELPQPSFEKKLIINKNAQDSSLYRFKLDESLATEEDYKAFCEYIYNYVGLDIYGFIGKSFKTFAKPQ